jgi:rare lipoprotein A
MAINRLSNRLFALVLGGSFLMSSPVNAHTATYYGNYNVGRTMANGQTYRHWKHVAAHPSLPLGSRVKVTNRRTGKSVVVTITDRCRCSIDLSRSALWG